MSKSKLNSIGISDSEIEEMNTLRAQKDEIAEALRQYEKDRGIFAENFNKHHIYIEFNPDKDTLGGQETTMAELPDVLNTRLAELNAEKTNLSESELAIIAERERSVKDVSDSKEIFQKTSSNHSDLIRRYAPRN